jgi:hypothetical protein
MVVFGALFGVVLRLWMRFVSTEPEFSWSGSVYIVGVFAILGLMAGLVGMARSRGGKGLLGTRIAGSVLALGCFMAAGAAMFPTIVPASLGVARTDWPRALRGGLIIFGATVAVLVVMSIDGLPLGHRLVALAMYLPLCAFEIIMVSRILEPSLPAGSVRDAALPLRLVCVALPLAAVFALVIVTIGIPTG